MFWRLHAQRLLVERGKTDVVPALVAAKRLSNGGKLPSEVRERIIHALCTLHGLGQLTGQNDEATDAAADVIHSFPMAPQAAVGIAVLPVPATPSRRPSMCHLAAP